MTKPGQQLEFSLKHTDTFDFGAFVDPVFYSDGKEWMIILFIVWQFSSEDVFFNEKVVRSVPERKGLSERLLGFKHFFCCCFFFFKLLDNRECQGNM